MDNYEATYVGRQYETRSGTRTVVGVSRQIIKRGTRIILAVICQNGHAGTVRRSDLVSVGMRECLGCRIERRRREGRRVSGNRTLLYRVWCSMRERCRSPKNNRWDRYGGRGITVCDEWSGDFLPFQTWAHANGYRIGLQIDRIDNDGPYSPENCRWVSRSTNCSNRVSSRFITAFGETKTLAQWSRDPRCAASKQTVLRRLQAGMPDHEAITTPIKWKKDKTAAKRGSQLYL